MCSGLARMLLSKAPVGRAYSGGWCGSFLLTLPESRAVSHCCACLPLGLRKWMEGHLGTSGGPEIPRDSRHPKHPPIHNAQVSCGNKGTVRLLATVRQVRRAVPFIATVLQTLYTSLSSTLWEPGGGPWGMGQPEGPLPESLAWPGRITYWLLSSISYSPDPPSSTPWTLGYHPGSCLVLKSPAYGWHFCLGVV